MFFIRIKSYKSVRGNKPHAKKKQLQCRYCNLLKINRLDFMINFGV